MIATVALQQRAKSALQAHGLRWRETMSFSCKRVLESDGDSREMKRHDIPDPGRVCRSTCAMGRREAWLSTKPFRLSNGDASGIAGVRS